MKFKFNAVQLGLAVGTMLAMLGAATPFLKLAPMWVGVVCGILAAGLNYLAHAMHLDVPSPPPTVLLLLVLAGAVLTTGCGASALQDGQVGLGIASQGVVAARDTVDTHRAQDCGTSPTSDCLHEHGYDVVTDALAAAYDAVVAGEAALRAAVTRNVVAIWLAVAPCVVASLTRLLAVMTDAGVQVPPWLTDAVTALGHFVGPCAEAPASAALRAMGPR